VHPTNSPSPVDKARSKTRQSTTSPPRSGEAANGTVAGQTWSDADLASFLISALGDAARDGERPKRPRYALLTKWLDLHCDLEATLTFGRIEKIVGGPLPASARARRSWWGNDQTHSHAKSWLSSGFLTNSVSLKTKTVTFRWNKRLAKTVNDNAVIDLMHSLGAPSTKQIPIADVVKKTSTLERDRLAFETMCEGLRRAGSAQIVFYPYTHEAQQGRRAQPGHGTIVAYEPGRRAISPMSMTFSDGKVIVERLFRRRSLGSISKWPQPRRIAGLQFVGLWQTKQRFLVAWPSAESMHSDDVQLVGAFTLSPSATPQECLRVCRWVLREADTFEDGLRKVLYRATPMYPMRALRLAETHLGRFVRPPENLARSLHRLWPMDPVMFIGADESGYEPMRAAFGPPPEGS